MTIQPYAIQDTERLCSPALVFYRDIIENNTRQAIAIAGDIERLWPHVKTHKSADVTRLMMAQGIRRFKCATIAEAQMLAECGAEHILLAYPLLGPNIQRFLALITRYPECHFYAIGDALAPLTLLSDAAADKGLVVDILLDINLGMCRSGLLPEQSLTVYEQANSLSGVAMRGIHCYDGHQHDSDFAARCQKVDAAMVAVNTLIENLARQGFTCDLRVMGGTPSFPCHARHPGFSLSPGTFFIGDFGYFASLPDLPLVPAAALLTRVISHPADGCFTLDLGYKGIAADPAGSRGVIVGLEHAEAVLHSEEHWVWRMQQGFEHHKPSLGNVMYVLPTHICPTIALYPSALVASRGVIIGEWPITARNRVISI